MIINGVLLSVIILGGEEEREGDGVMANKHELLGVYE